MHTVFRIASLIIIFGCSSVPELSDAGKLTSATDAQTDAGNHNNGNLCCNVTKNFTDSSYWSGGIYSCDPDAGVSTGTIMWVPWVCNPEQAVSCQNESCVIGSACQGFNGYGVVTTCY